MKKNMIIAIAVIAIVVVAGAAVALNMNSLFPSNNNSNTNGNNTDTSSDAVTSTNKTLDVDFWIDSVSDQKVSLDIDYPGKGQSDYNYSWNTVYQFNITSSPINGYSGNVLFKMYVLKQEEIALNDLKVVTSAGKTVEFSNNYRSGIYSLHWVMNVDVGSYKSNGSANGIRTFTVQFQDTLNYTFVYQAFDLDTGKAISSPITIGPLNVPVTGSLAFKAGTGQWDADTNGSFYAVLVNVTNNWNIRYTVDASLLYMYNGAEWVQANTTAMVFKTQSLADGQQTQFVAKFYNPVVPTTGFTLQYRDTGSGQIINIPLGG